MSSSNNEVNAHAKARHDYRSKSYQARKGSLVDIKNEYLDEIFDDILADNSIPEQILEQEEKIINRLIFNDDDNQRKQRSLLTVGNKTNNLGKITITVDVFNKTFLKNNHWRKLVEKIDFKYLNAWREERKVFLFLRNPFSPPKSVGTKMILAWDVQAYISCGSFSAK